MKHRMARHQVFPLVSLLLLGLLSCRPPGLLPTDIEPGEKTGSLVIRIAALQARTLEPSVDMVPAAYAISGSGPDGAAFETQITQDQASIGDLECGDWTITVEARNAEGLTIGQGQAPTRVEPGATRTLDIQISPLQGTGTLSLTVTWTAAQVPTPSIAAELVPSTGSAIPLTFTMGNGTATCTQTAVPTGYHTLVLRLKSGDTVVMGAMEIVRIVKDQTTSGTFDFLQANQPGGAIAVSITPRMENPLEVTLSGHLPEIPAGGTMTVNASVSPEASNVVYSWYLNGLARATGPSWTLGSGLEAGTYRLDVAAFSADGSQGGSTSCSFGVTAPSVSASCTLAWDANSESDLTGYRLYYGTASGNYGSPIDVGNTTTYRVDELDPGQTYFFSVTACNEAGQESGFSNEVMFVPL